MRFFVIISIIFLLLISFVYAEGVIFKVSDPTTTYITANTNASEIWITSEGNMDDVSDILGSDITNNLGWITSSTTKWDISSSNYLYNNSDILDVNETKLNATIDDRDSDTTYTAGFLLYLIGTQFNVNSTELNTTVNNSIDARVTQSFLELLGFNITTDLKDYFDSLYASISVIDTNETTRVDDLYSNISVFLFDSSAYVNCTGDEVFLGNGSCLNSSSLGGDPDTNETTRVDALYSNISVFLYDSNETSRVDLLVTENQTLHSEIDSMPNLSLTDITDNLGNFSAENDTLVHVGSGNLTLVDWANLTNVPTGLDDGDDVGSGGANDSIFFNKTATSMNANLSIAGLTGYEAGNYMCDSNFTGTHLCDWNEIKRTYDLKNVSEIDAWTGTAWVSGGPSKYTGVGVLFVNDCHGFTDATGTDSYGNAWSFTNNKGLTGNCGSEIPLACCKAW